MNTTRNILSAILAAGAPGVASLALNNVIRADLALGLLTVAGVVAVAIFDYSRPKASLRATTARMLRPGFPKAKTVSTAPVAINLRRAA